MSVAVLCSPARARAAASGFALALARSAGGSCALAGVVGGPPIGGPLGAMPAARGAAATLRDRGLPATASGRLVWLADRRAAEVVDDVVVRTVDEVLTRDATSRAAPACADVAAHSAALSAELGHAAAVVRAPAAIALPLPRTAALDRVLAWHDAILVVPEPGTSETTLQRALASLAALGRPVVPMRPPGRWSAALAVCGLRAPAEAIGAVAQLGLGDRGWPGRPGRRDA